MTVLPARSYSTGSAQAVVTIRDSAMTTDRSSAKTFRMVLFLLYNLETYIRSSVPFIIQDFSKKGNPFEKMLRQKNREEIVQYR